MARKLTKNTAEIWGAMALSAVFFESSEAYRGVVSWYRTCHRLGIRLPIFLIHDLGALLSAPRGTSYLILERREVLRRCLAHGRRLDEVEILHTEARQGPRVV